MGVDAWAEAADSLSMQKYRQRREQAASFWQGLPRHAFNMTQWGCGTAACALGWLAAEKFDGWESARRGENGELGVPHLPSGLTAYMAAAYYFGLKIAEAQACFGSERQTAILHGRWFVSRIRPHDVAQTLLALPYTSQPNRHALR